MNTCILFDYKCDKPVKIQSYTTKNIIYLDVSTSTGSLHQKNEVIISSSGSWHSKQ